MKNLNKETAFEAVNQILALGESTIKNHPIVLQILSGKLNKETLNVILLCFYADGLWWVSALQYMHKHTRNPRFKQALLDNLNCETGAGGGTPHMLLLNNFFESIMLSVDMKNPIYAGAIKRAQHENKILHRSTEQQRAGFMLATEHLFPTLLACVRPAIIEHYPDCDMDYIDEHIEVDADEHSIWMKESVIEILNSNIGLADEILQGMKAAEEGAFYPLETALSFTKNRTVLYESFH